MSDLRWEVLESKYLVNAPWAVLRRDVCQMPNGHIVPEYYVLEYPDWANVVALTEDGHFILVKQYRHGAGEVFLEIPGGVIDEGETALNAAKREMIEETGYEFESFEEVCKLYPNPATSNNMTTTFLARGGVKVHEQTLDSQEDIEVLLASPEEVKELLFENKFGQSLHASALFYALKHLSLIA